MFLTHIDTESLTESERAAAKKNYEEDLVREKTQGKDLSKCLVRVCYWLIIFLLRVSRSFMIFLHRSRFHSPVWCNGVQKAGVPFEGFLPAHEYECLSKM